MFEFFLGLFVGLVTSDSGQRRRGWALNGLYQQKTKPITHNEHSLESPRKQGGVDFCKPAVELMLTVSFFREVNGSLEWQEDFELPYYTGKASIHLTNKLLFELVTQHNTSTGIQTMAYISALSQSGSILELLCHKAVPSGVSTTDVEFTWKGDACFVRIALTSHGSKNNIMEV